MVMLSGGGTETGNGHAGGFDIRFANSVTDSSTDRYSVVTYVQGMNHRNISVDLSLVFDLVLMA